MANDSHSMLYISTREVAKYHCKKLQFCTRTFLSVNIYPPMKIIFNTQVKCFVHILIENSSSSLFLSEWKKADSDELKHAAKTGFIIQWVNSRRTLWTNELTLSITDYFVFSFLWIVHRSSC